MSESNSLSVTHSCHWVSCFKSNRWAQQGSAGLWYRPSYEASGNLLVHQNFFISYILSDQVWWHNIKWFLNYSKNYICKFMQANSWHHKLFHFHLSFWIWKVWKGREKITKIWISQERKELFRWNKKYFS